MGEATQVCESFPVPLFFRCQLTTLSFNYSIQLPSISDLGYVSLSYSPRLPCNDTLYQLWETQPDNSSDWDDYNSCLDYDFPQDDVATNQESTTMPTTTSTATSSSRGAGPTGNDATESAKLSASTQPSSTVIKSTESPGLESGARQSFFVPLINWHVLLVPMMASCLIASAAFS